MSFWNKLFGSGVKAAGEGIQSAGEGVKTVFDSGGNLLNSIRTAITGVDANKKAELEQYLAELDAHMQDGRQKIEEIITLAGASHKNPFVAVFLAGWRPFIGWVCGFSLAFYFIPQYVMGSIVWIRAAWMAVPYMKDGVLVIPQIPVYPVSAEGLFQLTLGILGLVVMRSVDKYNKVTNTH